MAGITGMGTTYNLPNYVGELFSVSREDTPLLSAIGGLTGGRSTGGKTFFDWQYYDLRDAEADRQRTEGYTAQNGEQRVRSTARNVVEIHQEWVELSYTRQATTGQQNAGGEATVTIGGTTLTVSELAFQLNAQFKQIARDVNKVFYVGQFQNPSDNNTPRKTRGLLQAITTNVETISTPTLGNSSSIKAFGNKVLDLMQSIWTAGGIRETETRTIIVNAFYKRALTEAFISERNYQEQTRNVGGVNLQTIETDFGRCNVMLDQDCPTPVVASLEDLAPRFLEIPGKGHFFVEPLAKTGASDKLQIYGEIGLEYGNERKHGKLTVTGGSSSSSSSSSS